jgi:vacuolar iron transporter family protein
MQVGILGSVSVAGNLRTKAGSLRAWGRRTSPSHPSRRSTDVSGWEHHHRGIQGGGARAAVFGVTDGLVTNVSVILGAAAANPGPGVVRLVGLVSLIGGAFSMANGEWVSMRAQRELLERELAIEQHEITHRPEGERRELVRIYENRGVEPSVARTLASEMMRTPELALETHAREELGITPGSLGQPLQAAVSSFCAFALGALLPLIPWLAWHGNGAKFATVIVGVVSALAVGAALSVFTLKSWWRSGIRTLVNASVAAGVTYGIGTAVGVGVH